MRIWIWRYQVANLNLVQTSITTQSSRVYDAAEGVVSTQAMLKNTLAIAGDSQATAEVTRRKYSCDAGTGFA